jgi:hypothetical protein
MSPKLPPPPPARGTAPARSAPPAEPAKSKDFAITSGPVVGPQRVLIYGTGGIGKSSLAALAPKPLFLDVEGSTKKFSVDRIEDIETFAELRTVLGSDKLDPFETIVIDTVTKAEELAIAHTLATVPHEKGHRVDRLESYGFGKGLSHAYETFMLLLQECDRVIRRGKHVVLIAHDCINDVPNPVGDDFIRFEPHLQSPKSGKSSIRNRVVQWADHVLFVGYDIISTDGKGKGGGTRSIWTTERPDHIAKVRGAKEGDVPESMPYEYGDGAIWTYLLGGEK